MHPTCQPPTPLRQRGFTGRIPPIDKVEVQIDGGPWERAQIDRTPKDKYTWRFFHYDWKNPAPGQHTVVSRATAAEDPAMKLKKTYWESNHQWVWKLNT